MSLGMPLIIDFIDFRQFFEILLYLLCNAKSYENMQIELSSIGKNTREPSRRSFALEKDLSIHVIRTTEEGAHEITSAVDKGTVQISMCMEGELKFWFGPSYSMDLLANQVMT
ncbi:MAG: hypothetical protein AB8B53_12060, partial [Flavobacteriales bacterium]